MRGGKIEERLYLYDMPSLGIEKTDMPNMADLIARHKARYYLVGFFCRPGMKVLDFPCGSGYGSEVLAPFGIRYEGRDIDDVTLHYCRAKYDGIFGHGDLALPHLTADFYDIIACIVGLEHIDEYAQENLIYNFFMALRPGGILVVSTPEKQGETINQYHRHELTNREFYALLEDNFCDVQVLEHKDTLHNGTQTNLLMGICRKEG